MKNILLLNVGTRNKLVSYFKKELNSRAKVIATDNFFLAPALYEADKHYITKKWNEKDYWDNIFQICEKDNVGLILSLIDSDLVQLAERKEEFAKRGILVNISTSDAVKACFDKYATMEFLRANKLPYIKTYNYLQEVEDTLLSGELQYPLFSKPRYGSGSADIVKIQNMTQLQQVMMNRNDMIVQEYMQGQEFGVDVYIDILSKEIISIFIKKKLKMRAGETDKSVSYKDSRLFDLVECFVKLRGLEGANDIDVIERDNKYYILEVNPRFGGGYLHAYECGENFPKYLINNMNGIKNNRDVGRYQENVYVMKYFDVKILKSHESESREST